jgi:transcriptional regulator with XRE-family HTH domain
LVAERPNRERLAARLRELREATGLSGNRFAAERMGWTQSRLSRLELGQQLPTEEDVHAWARGVDADPETLAELVGLLQRARVEYESNRDAVRQAGSIAGDQARIGRRYARAARVRHYQPGMIPGVLQTAEYARELLSLPCGPATFGATAHQIEEKIAGRIKQQDVLYESGRRLQYVLGEPALRTPPRSVEALIGQLDRLALLAGLPNIEIGVSPLGHPMPVIPLSGFVLYDEDFVTIETLDGEHRLSDDQTVKLYAEAFAQLRAGAAVGTKAVELIRSVMAELQAGGNAT